MKKNTIENIVPIVISVKHLFERRHSPLLKDLLLCLKELMQVRPVWVGYYGSLLTVHEWEGKLLKAIIVCLLRMLHIRSWCGKFWYLLLDLQCMLIRVWWYCSLPPQDYRNEVGEILVADKQLAEEIEFDLKMLEEEQKKAAAAKAAIAAASTPQAATPHAQMVRGYCTHACRHRHTCTRTHTREKCQRYTMTQWHAKLRVSTCTYTCRHAFRPVVPPVVILPLVGYPLMPLALTVASHSIQCTIIHCVYMYI